MIARLPNEWRNGVTVGMGIDTAFSKTTHLLSICGAELESCKSRATWLARGCFIMLNVNFREKVNPEIQLEVKLETL